MASSVTALNDIYIFTDNGASKGLRTRLFRDCANGKGVEWLYAVDYFAGRDHWLRFGMVEGYSIEMMRKDGYDLQKITKNDY